MIFKQADLKKFLNHIRQNYTVTSLGKWNGKPAIILRHDVDFDVKAAYDMAVVEKECKIDSTFFIMTTSCTYNPMALPTRNYIKEINDMGFEVGLHFDPSIYGENDMKLLSEKVSVEANILSSIIGRKVLSVSVHNPSVHGQYPMFEGFNNAYNKDIFGQDRYISDSRMQFRSDIYEFVKKVSEHPIQILLHPFHFTKEGKEYPQIFFEFIINFINRVDDTFRVNSKYNASLGKTTLCEYILNSNHNPKS